MTAGEEAAGAAGARTAGEETAGASGATKAGDEAAGATGAALLKVGFRTEKLVPVGLV
jgi:hypothetical protein